MKRTLIAASVFVAIGIPAVVAEEVSTPRQRPALMIELYPGSGISAAENDGEWESPRATIYNATDCDFPEECAIVGLDCSNGLNISVESVDEAELARWLDAPGDLSIGVTGLGMEGKTPQAWEMQLSELDGNWAVIFRVGYSSDPGLTIEGDELVISAPPRTVNVPLVGNNRERLEKFVQLCARE